MTTGAASSNNPNNNYEVTNPSIQRIQGDKADVTKPAQFKGIAKINGRDVTVTLSYQRGIDDTTANKDMQITMKKVALLMQEKELGSVYTSATFKGSSITLKAAKGQEAELTDKDLTKHVSNTIKKTKQEIKDLKKEDRRLEKEVGKLNREFRKLKGKTDLERKTHDDKLKKAQEDLGKIKTELTQKREKQTELNGYTRILKNKLPKNTSTNVLTSDEKPVSVPPRPRPVIKTPLSPPSETPRPPVPRKGLSPTPTQPIPKRPFEYGGKENSPSQGPSRPAAPTRGLPPTPTGAPQVSKRSLPTPPGQAPSRPQQPPPGRPLSPPPPLQSRTPAGQAPSRPPQPPLGRPQGPPPPLRTVGQTPSKPQSPPPVRPEPPPARPQRPQGRQAEFGAHDLKKALRTTPPSMQTATPTSTPASSPSKAQTITSFDRSKKLSEQALPPVLGEDFDSKNFVADDLPSDKTKVLNVMREILTTEKVFATNMNKTIKGLDALESELKKQGKELSPSIVNYREALKAILEASNKFTEKLETLHQADGKVHVSSLIDTMNSPELHVILTHLGKASTAFQAGVLSEVSKLTTGTTAKDKQVLEAVNKAIDNDPGGLGGLVIQPIQRGPRYQLLAGDLFKGIDREGIYRKETQTKAGEEMDKAIATIREGITGYNEAIRRKEIYSELRLLQRANLNGGLPIWNGSEYKRVTTRNIKPDDFIRTLEHLTRKKENSGKEIKLEISEYLNESHQELEVLKDLPRVFTAFKSVAENKFKKVLSEEQKSHIADLTRKLDGFSEIITSKDVAAIQFQVGQKLKILDRLPRNSQADLSLVRERFEELEKWGQSVISQTKDPKVKEMVNRELAAKRSKISLGFEAFFKERVNSLNARGTGQGADPSLVKDIQEFRKFATESSTYIPDHLMTSPEYNRLIGLSFNQGV